MFQMLRGTMVVFTGILTVTLLKRKLHYHHWLGIVLISAGAAIVGASRQSLPFETAAFHCNGYREAISIQHTLCMVIEFSWPNRQQSITCTINLQSASIQAFMYIVVGNSSCFTLISWNK